MNADWTSAGSQVLAAAAATFAALVALRIARKDRRVSAERADLQRQYDLLLRLTVAAEPRTVSTASPTPSAPDTTHEATALLMALGHERLPITWAFHFSEWPDGKAAHPAGDWQASRRERMDLLRQLAAEIRATY